MKFSPTCGYIKASSSRSAKFYCLEKLYRRRYSSRNFYDILLDIFTWKSHNLWNSAFSWRTCGSETADQSAGEAAEVIKEGEVYQWVSNGDWNLVESRPRDAKK